jgi:hypothetical protein
MWAAIIQVDADEVITDSGGIEHVILNPNVLIEIGAAMAFYGRRFILLVREGVQLPSNLQGLYEVRYTSEVLDAAATIKLLEAMKDIKNYSLPTDLDRIAVFVLIQSRPRLLRSADLLFDSRVAMRRTGGGRKAVAPTRRA